MRQKLVIVFLFLFQLVQAQQPAQSVSLSGVYQNQDIFTSLGYSRDSKNALWNLQFNFSVGTRRALQGVYFGRYQFRGYYTFIIRETLRLSPWLGVEYSHYSLTNKSEQFIETSACLTGVQIEFGSKIRGFLSGGMGKGLFVFDHRKGHLHTVFNVEIGLRYAW
ncbi:MAG: hypothetical protein KJ941_01390 [Bacteroidetes bacterium]|nr:hypothetical protein [Bacteroidota bacterium]